MAGPARNVAERVAAVETDTLESVFGILHNGMRMERARRLEDLWSHIHCLGILAETGSFTAAALRLQLSKASVSQRIAELEKAVGLPLVRRTTRGVSLTEAGAHLVEQTAAAFQRIEAGYSAVKDLSAGPRGVLAMTAPVALGRQVIAPLIPAFLKRYPDVQIQLDLSDRLAALATEGFDLAIRHVAEVPDTHVASLIGEIRSVLVATPRYLAEHGMPAVPADLERHDCIHYLRRSGAAAWAFRRPGRTSACRCRSGQLRGQQQRGIARGRIGFRRHRAAARFQRGSGAARRDIGRGAGRLAGGRRLRRPAVRGQALYAACAARGVLVRRACPGGPVRA